MRIRAFRGRHLLTQVFRLLPAGVSCVRSRFRPCIQRNRALLRALQELVVYAEPVIQSCNFRSQLPRFLAASPRRNHDKCGCQNCRGAHYENCGMIQKTVLRYRTAAQRFHPRYPPSVRAAPRTSALVFKIFFRPAVRGIASHSCRNSTGRTVCNYVVRARSSASPVPTPPAHHHYNFHGGRVSERASIAKSFRNSSNPLEKLRDQDLR